MTLGKVSGGRQWLWFWLGAVWLAGAASATAAPVPTLRHEARIRLDITAHTLTADVTVQLPAGLDHLRLGPDLVVDEIAAGGQTSAAGHVTLEQGPDGDFQRIDLAAIGLDRGGSLRLAYSGTFHEPVDDVVFSRENVGGEITATIGEEGIYLSAAAGWLPWHPDALATHDVSLDTPAGFETVTQGRRTEHETRAERLHTRWVAPYPADGLNIVANRYVVHDEPVRDGVTSYTFFLEDDARLRETYMERTKAYITMYEEMIGPYPYSKFATVENWFPTGYGMPSYTLLGSQVLRLPFIPYTSFGHEICHNWWGNSVFVDPQQGNWCEGLTVYCADYHYKELESPEAARTYRRNLLKDYAAYTRDRSLDFPLSEFMSRHSGATRAVGYGKSMMVFHQVERMIGREAFLQGLQDVAAGFLHARAGWSDFFAAFSARSGRDLSRQSEQWLDRAGAPVLRLDETEFANDSVSFRLSQGAPPYALEVPVVVTTAAGDRQQVIRLETMSERFSLEADGPVRLVVDPDYDVFRRLEPLEIEPTLSQVLADDAPAYILDGADETMVAAAHVFAGDFSDVPFYELNNEARLPVDYEPGTGHSNVVINPGRELEALYPVGELTVAGNTIVLQGRRYSLGEYDLVYCAANPHGGDLTDLVIHCASIHRLPNLARRLGHYGKYSWLLLPVGQGRPLRGNWQPAGAPLTAEKVED